MSDRDFKGIWIPAAIWLDDRLSAQEMVILAEIDSLDKEDGCWASNEYLAKFCKCSAGTVSRAIANLKKFGYIRVKSFDGRKRVLESCLINMTRLPNQIDKAASSKCEAIKLYDKVNDNNKEEEEKETLNSIIEAHTSNEELRQALKDFLKHRKTLKKPMTNRALKMLLSHLDNNTTSDRQKIDAIDKAIYHGWQTVYFNSKQKENTTDNMTESERKTLEILMEYGA